MSLRVGQLIVRSSRPSGQTAMDRLRNIAGSQLRSALDRHLSEFGLGEVTRHLDSVCVHLPASTLDNDDAALADIWALRIALALGYELAHSEPEPGASEDPAGDSAAVEQTTATDNPVATWALEFAQLVRKGAWGDAAQLARVALAEPSSFEQLTAHPEATELAEALWSLIAAHACDHPREWNPLEEGRNGTVPASAAGDSIAASITRPQDPRTLQPLPPQTQQPRTEHHWLRPSLRLALALMADQTPETAVAAKVSATTPGLDGGTRRPRPQPTLGAASQQTIGRSPGHIMRVGTELHRAGGLRVADRLAMATLSTPSRSHGSWLTDSERELLQADHVPATVGETSEVHSAPTCSSQPSPAGPSPWPDHAWGLHERGSLTAAELLSMAPSWAQAQGLVLAATAHTASSAGDIDQEQASILRAVRDHWLHHRSLRAVDVAAQLLRRFAQSIPTAAGSLTGVAREIALDALFQLDSRADSEALATGSATIARREQEGSGQAILYESMSRSRRALRRLASTVTREHFGHLLSSLPIESLVGLCLRERGLFPTPGLLAAVAQGDRAALTRFANDVLGTGPRTGGAPSSADAGAVGSELALAGLVDPPQEANDSTVPGQELLQITDHGTDEETAPKRPQGHKLAREQTRSETPEASTARSEASGTDDAPSPGQDGRRPPTPEGKSMSENPNPALLDGNDRAAGPSTRQESGVDLDPAQTHPRMGQQARGPCQRPQRESLQLRSASPDTSVPGAESAADGRDTPSASEEIRGKTRPLDAADTPAVRTEQTRLTLPERPPTTRALHHPPFAEPTASRGHRLAVARALAHHVATDRLDLLAAFARMDTDCGVDALCQALTERDLLRTDSLDAWTIVGLDLVALGMPTTWLDRDTLETLTSASLSITPSEGVPPRRIPADVASAARTWFHQRRARTPARLVRRLRVRARAWRLGHEGLPTAALQAQRIEGRATSLWEALRGSGSDIAAATILAECATPALTAAWRHSPPRDRSCLWAWATGWLTVEGADDPAAAEQVSKARTAQEGSSPGATDTGGSAATEHADSGEELTRWTRAWEERFGADAIPGSRSIHSQPPTTPPDHTIGTILLHDVLLRETAADALADRVSRRELSLAEAVLQTSDELELSCLCDAFLADPGALERAEADLSTWEKVALGLCLRGLLPLENYRQADRRDSAVAEVLAPDRTHLAQETTGSVIAAVAHRSEHQPDEPAREEFAVSEALTAPPDLAQSTWRETEVAGLIILHAFLVAADRELQNELAENTEHLHIDSRAWLLAHAGAEGAAADVIHDPVVHLLSGNLKPRHVTARPPLTPQRYSRMAKRLLKSLGASIPGMESHSAETLRRYFIRRTGAVRCIAEGEFEVLLVRGDLDMLLENSPVTLGMVALPWVGIIHASIAHDLPTSIASEEEC